MSDINYVVGDATDPPRDRPSIVVHVCNDIGAWGKGFVLAVSRRWSQPERDYRGWARDGGAVPFELGQVQIVQVEETVWIANLIGQHGIKRQGGNPPIRYEAIREGLRGVAAEAIAKNAAVHMPRIGCGLAGGSWEKIESIIRTELTAAGVPVFVYDFPGS